MRIVFVCTTNVWGSAMADLVARSLLSEWDPERQLVQVESVGVRAQVDAPIPLPAQRVLAELGLEAGEHRARWMKPESLAGADLVLTMGEVQREAALGMNPRGLRSTFTLLEAARLLNGLAVTAPLAPTPDRHAHAVIAEMAKARRFRNCQASADDLPDLVGDDPRALRALADLAHGAVYTVLEAIVLPQFVQDAKEPSAALSATAVA